MFDGCTGTTPSPSHPHGSISPSPQSSKEALPKLCHYEGLKGEEEEAISNPPVKSRRT